jgi:hypothetical protein
MEVAGNTKLRSAQLRAEAKRAKKRTSSIVPHQIRGVDIACTSIRSEKLSPIPLAAAILFIPLLRHVFPIV